MVLQREGVPCQGTPSRWRTSFRFFVPSRGRSLFPSRSGVVIRPLLPRPSRSAGLVKIRSLLPSRSAGLVIRPLLPSAFQGSLLSGVALLHEQSVLAVVVRTARLGLFPGRGIVAQKNLGTQLLQGLGQSAVEHEGAGYLPLFFVRNTRGQRWDFHNSSELREPGTQMIQQ